MLNILQIKYIIKLQNKIRQNKKTSLNSETLLCTIN